MVVDQETGWRPELPLSLALTGTVGLLLLGLLMWWALEALNIFGVPMLFLLFAFIGLAGSLLHLKRHARTRTGFAIAPLAVLFFVLFLWYNHCIHRLRMLTDFHLKSAARQDVVELVHAGALEPPRPGASLRCKGLGTRLPPRYAHLSTCGEIDVSTLPPDRTVILFFTTLGPFASYSGFIYRSDDSAPDRVKKYEQLAAHWFFVDVWEITSSSWRSSIDTRSGQPPGGPGPRAARQARKQLASNQPARRRRWLASKAASVRIAVTTASPC